ncbi:MAG: hypothetical protein HZB72_09155 [Burkholderiales bacterium]|nr:hypothetical protein [Burkholderiales bacterium]
MAGETSPLRLGVIEPRDAVAAFERRGLLQPSFRWQDVWQEEHARAFAVAGVQRLDVLQTVRDALDTKLSQGGSLADFRRAVRGELAAAGYWGDVEITDPATGETRMARFDNRRLQLIYDVNVRQSYASGRWAAIERNKKLFPFVRYVTMGDERVRASHKPWHNLVLPVDDPFWQTHFPPNGWRCRCQAMAVDQKMVDRLKAAGQDIKTQAPPADPITYVNPRTGEIVPIPRGIDPGFAYNPGAQRDAALHETLLRKALEVSPLPGAVAVAVATFANPAMLQQSTARFGAWVDDVMARGQAQGELQYIGAIAPRAARVLEQLGLQPRNAVIAVRDGDVLHALRDAKVAAGVALDASVYRRLPELLQRASAMLLERKPAAGMQPALLYVIDLVRPDGQVGKLVLQLDQFVRIKGGGEDGRRRWVQLNVLRTATVMDPSALADRRSYKLLWGRLSEEPGA